VERIVKCFEQTGNIKNRAKSDKSATSPDKALDILLSFVEDLHNSICDITQQQDIIKI